MANPWVLLVVCWYLKHSIAFTQSQHIPRASLEITSLNPSTQPTSFVILPSTSSLENPPIGSILTGDSVDSSTKSNTKSSTLPPEELLLSGTHYNEALSPTVASLNETATNAPASTLTDLNGTKTVLHPHLPTNAQPCNLHVEFCGRSYGNITYVGAHNSPFTRENNAAANQHLDTTTQLNDGIRMRMYY